MILTKKLLNKFEQGQRWRLPEELKTFLLHTYSTDDEMYPSSEYDLFHWIRKDIQSYEDGNLDIMIKSKEEKLEGALKLQREENESLFRKLKQANKQIYELEELLKENNVPLPEWCEKLFF